MTAAETRKPGFFWVKRYGEWVVGEWVPKSAHSLHGPGVHGAWFLTVDDNNDGFGLYESEISEIDERRIERDALKEAQNG